MYHIIYHSGGKINGILGILLIRPAVSFPTFAFVHPAPQGREFANQIGIIYFRSLPYIQKHTANFVQPFQNRMKDGFSIDFPSQLM